MVLSHGDALRLISLNHDQSEDPQSQDPVVYDSGVTYMFIQHKLMVAAANSHIWLEPMVAGYIGYILSDLGSDDRFWDDEANYTFVRAEIKKLDDDGNLSHKFFTIVGESNSTKMADDFLKARFPELWDSERVLNMYPNIEVELWQHYMVDDQFQSGDKKKLEDDGNLAHKFFTIVDKSNSTKVADDFLKARFPELSDS
ncbi:hypothetical protein Q3G72_025752 [Acer saccharum]|nr:hypothetical protein Q3G72_025752 [Acer saccharum]